MIIPSNSQSSILLISILLRSLALIFSFSYTGKYSSFFSLCLTLCLFLCVRKVCSASCLMKKRSIVPCRVVSPVHPNWHLQGGLHVSCMCPAVVAEPLFRSVQSSAVALPVVGSIGYPCCQGASLGRPGLESHSYQAFARDAVAPDCWDFLSAMP